MKLKLILEQIVLEIGDSAKIYSFNESQIPEWNNDDLILGAMKKIFFKDKFNQKYIVELEPKYKFLDVGFKISGEGYDQETGKFDVLSIMNTISEIVKFTIQKTLDFLELGLLHLQKECHQLMQEIEENPEIDYTNIILTKNKRTRHECRIY